MAQEPRARRRDPARLGLGAGRLLTRLRDGASCTEDGDVVVVSPTIQFFSTLADLIVKWTLENRSASPGIADGDVFMQNDPYIGAAQQSDTAFYAPIFWDGKLFCWVFNTLHVGDLGGVDPGGWAVNARDFFDESIAVPPLKLAEQGTVAVGRRRGVRPRQPRAGQHPAQHQERAGRPRGRSASRCSRW